VRQRPASRVVERAVERLYDYLEKSKSMMIPCFEDRRDAVSPSFCNDTEYVVGIIVINGRPPESFPSVFSQCDVPARRSWPVTFTAGS
jgi:hypothetical protein